MELLFDVGRHADGRKGMATELKEIIPRAYPLNIQDLLPYFSQFFFRRPARCFIILLGPLLHRTPCKLRQCGPVEFSGSQAWKSLPGDPTVWNHELLQGQAGMLMHMIHSDLRGEASKRCIGEESKIGC